MKIEIVWSNVYQISAASSRDVLEVTILDNEQFFSASRRQYIPVGQSDYVKAPTQMPNDEFTKSYEAVTEAAQTMISITLVSNFAVNLVLSGAMTLLWGMLNGMQIVAHFDLVNIMMPANAHLLFKVLVQIATFDLVPSESIISEMEDGLGIENDEFALTDSFIDFEFDTSSPVNNLQVMFLAMVLLVALPILFVAMKGIFFWN